MMKMFYSLESSDQLNETPPSRRGGDIPYAPCDATGVLHVFCTEDFTKEF